MILLKIEKEPLKPVLMKAKVMKEKGNSNSWIDFNFTPKVEKKKQAQWNPTSRDSTLAYIEKNGLGPYLAKMLIFLDNHPHFWSTPRYNYESRSEYYINTLKYTVEIGKVILYDVCPLLERAGLIKEAQGLLLRYMAWNRYMKSNRNGEPWAGNLQRMILEKVSEYELWWPARQDEDKILEALRRFKPGKVSGEEWVSFIMDQFKGLVLTGQWRSYRFQRFFRELVPFIVKDTKVFYHFTQDMGDEWKNRWICERIHYALELAGEMELAEDFKKERFMFSS